MDTNLTGVFYCCHATLPYLRTARRRLDHQHQQPGQPQRVRQRRRVLRLEVGAERLQRVADAGGPLRRHPRRLRAPGIGEHRLRRRCPTPRRKARCCPKMSRKSSATCLPIRRAACRAASRSAPRSRHERADVTAFDKHQRELEVHETMMGSRRGRLAVAMDLLTDALAMVGQHGIYCQSTRDAWPSDAGHRSGRSNRSATPRNWSRA